MAKYDSRDNLDSTLQNTIAIWGIEHPCPFCGSWYLYLGPESAMTQCVQCIECGARTKGFSFEDVEGYGKKKMSIQKWDMAVLRLAVKAWNRRE
jgi:hypothetical protein